MNEVIVGDEPVNLRLQEIDLLQGDDTEGIEQIFLLKHSDIWLKTLSTDH